MKDDHEDRTSKSSHYMLKNKKEKKAVKGGIHICTKYVACLKDFESF